MGHLKNTQLVNRAHQVMNETTQNHIITLAGPRNSELFDWLNLARTNRTKANATTATPPTTVQPRSSDQTRAMAKMASTATTPNRIFKPGTRANAFSSTPYGDGFPIGKFAPPCWNSTEFSSIRGSKGRLVNLCVFLWGTQIS